MPLKLDVGSNELASLICSKVCHDLVSPVSAMSMSLEMLDEPGSAEEAMDLVRQSVKTAATRLKFCRLAFGASGSAGASIDTGDAMKVALDYVEEERPEVTWKVERMILPKDKVKLLLNLVLVSLGTVPRGGTIEVSSKGGEDDISFRIHSEGRRARVPTAFEEMVDGDLPTDGVNTQTVQAYYTMLLAKETGMPIAVEFGEEFVTITAG